MLMALAEAALPGGRDAVLAVVRKVIVNDYTFTSEPAALLAARSELGAAIAAAILQ